MHMRNTLITILTGAVAVFFSLQAGAQVPRVINYQGRIVVNGTNYHGVGAFKFAIGNADFSETYWSNDGKAPPLNDVDLTISRGLFSVALGDTNVPNMTALPGTNCFDHESVYLRVWFDDGASGSQQLVPDQRFLAGAYALMADDIADNRITSEKIVDGSITGADVGTGVITSTNLAANSVTASEIAYQAVGSSELDDNAVGSSDLQDSIDLGNLAAYGYLDVFFCSSDPTTPSVQLNGLENALRINSDDGHLTAYLRGYNRGYMYLYDESGDSTVYLNAGTDDGGYLGLDDALGNPQLHFYGLGENNSGQIDLTDSGSSPQLSLYGDANEVSNTNTASGGAGIDLMDENSDVRLALRGNSDDGYGAQISMFNDNDIETIWMDSDESFGSIIDLKDGSGTDANRLRLASDDSIGGYVYIYNKIGNASIFLDGDDNGASHLTLYNSNAYERIMLDGQNAYGGGGIIIDDNNGTIGIRLDGMSDADSGGKITVNAADGSTGVTIDGDEDGDGVIEVSDESSATTIRLDSDQDRAGQITLYDDAGTTLITLEGAETADTGGQLVMNDRAGNLRLELDADYAFQNSASLLMRASNNVTTVFLESSDTGNDGAKLTLSQYDGADSFVLDAESGQLTMKAADGSTSIVLDADESGDGVIELQDESENRTVRLDSDVDNGGRITLYNSVGESGVLLEAAESAGAGGQIYVYNNNNEVKVEIDGDHTSYHSGLIFLKNSNGVNTVQLYGSYNGTEDGRIITDELQITGGSDLSEQFDVLGPNEAVAPGLLVCIAPDGSGALTVSKQPYDGCVAGIISGAGGVKPGMLMGQKGTPADGQHPVALSGRVYAWADTSNGSIRPGDLLTTSSRPGHAMKATDHERAYGAVIGKAMSSLDEDTGLVLVLVQPR